MLQNIQKCTDAVAKAIVQDYPTVYSLYDAYSKTQSIEEAEMLLADIEVMNWRCFMMFRNCGRADQSLSVL